MRIPWRLNVLWQCEQLCKLRLLVFLHSVVCWTSFAEGHKLTPRWTHLKAASEVICQSARLHFLSSFCFFSRVSSLMLTDSTPSLTYVPIHSCPRPCFSGYHRGQSSSSPSSAGHSICTIDHRQSACQKAENKQVVCGRDGYHSCGPNVLQSSI